MKRLFTDTYTYTGMFEDTKRLYMISFGDSSKLLIIIAKRVCTGNLLPDKYYIKRVVDYK